MKKTIKKISFIAIMLCVVMLAANCKKDDSNGNNTGIPVLTTTNITDITQTSAKSGGNITSDGGTTVTVRGVCWSIGQTPTISDNKTIDGTGAGIFVSNINNLLAGTTYYVRAYATNSNGTGYGSTMSFTTNTQNTPTLTTNSISNITTNTATCGGNITSDAGSPITSRGVCWSTATAPTITNNITIDGIGTGSFTSQITGLTLNSTYYVRAYATNANGTSYGNEISFQTPSTLIPVQKQWGLVIEYTATFSAPCGQWGANAMNTLCNTPYVVGIACHSASVDPMYNAALYSSFSSDRTDNASVPKFWIGDISSFSTSDMSTLLAQTPTAAIGLNYTKTATSMTVNTKTIFYTTGSGNYFLSVYLLESGIDGSTSAPSAYQQIGATNPTNYQHNWVLRNTSIANNAYGESIVNGTVTNGQTIDKTYTISLDPSWTKTLFPVAVLWKYNASSTAPKYKFVNCFQIK